MTASDQSSAAYLAALKLLTGRDYTRLALLRKLRQRGFQADEAQVTADRLAAEGYLQDQRYAERIVAMARESGRYTGIRLRQELQRRGVPSEIVAEVLQDAPDAAHEQEQALGLVTRRFTGSALRTDDERTRRRIAGFLQRRGYGSDVIRSVLQQAAAQHDQQE